MCRTICTKAEHGVSIQAAVRYRKAPGVRSPSPQPAPHAIFASDYPRRLHAADAAGGRADLGDDYSHAHQGGLWCFGRGQKAHQRQFFVNTELSAKSNLYKLDKTFLTYLKFTCFI